MRGIRELQREEITLLKELGSAQFGAVHLGKWKGQEDVAVRVIRSSVSEDESFPEAQTMRIWELQSEERTLLKSLGSGQFGAVHQGKWKGQEDVAVKVIRSSVSEDEFFLEAQTMRFFQFSDVDEVWRPLMFSFPRNVHASQHEDWSPGQDLNWPLSWKTLRLRLNVSAQMSGVWS
ncbi:hypothetical protein E5288_WYG012197 [Bos mutus]|uniref:Serine-threonine/tyrosine-protein kinase catalytic domain-containing protein n=1 Tax=Bos mutus TaxID=72004 RepID=A0A6B0RIV5_9CETA|nr:hypothetical protein [Bos mutus]